MTGQPEPKTERNQKIYKMYLDRVQSGKTAGYAMIGREFGISRQRVEGIIEREAENRGEEFKKMGRKKKYSAILPATSATTEQRAFVDWLNEKSGMNPSDVMRQCVDDAIASLDKKNRREFNKFVERVTA